MFRLGERESERDGIIMLLAALRQTSQRARGDMAGPFVQPLRYRSRCPEPACHVAVWPIWQYKCSLTRQCFSTGEHWQGSTGINAHACLHTRARECVCETSSNIALSQAPTYFL